MEVPSTVSALWAQRKRWARGQGEVLHRHLRAVSHWRQHRMWLLSLESVASLIWVVAMALATLLSLAAELAGAHPFGLFGFGIAWGIAISVVAIGQLLVALWLGFAYDRWDPRSLSVAAVYPLLYWIVAAAAALHSQIGAFVHGPRERRVVWDIPRERQQAS
jgi:biofilm PGA synthesis N-glycosyltransferase PgaC